MNWEIALSRVGGAKPNQLPTTPKQDIDLGSDVLGAAVDITSSWPEIGACDMGSMTGGEDQFEEGE